MTAGFGLGGIAILLRMASDWLFPQGGPLPYQLLQAALLVSAVVCLWPRLDMVFLRGGDQWKSIKYGLIMVPLAIAFGLLGAYAWYGGPVLPSWDAATAMILNNLFFPAVEELEFRGFMLGWLVSKKVPIPLAIGGTAVVHVLAHPHWILQGEYALVVIGLALFLWLGYITAKTRSIWGAYVAHASWNIFGFLPLIASGYNR